MDQRNSNGGTALHGVALTAQAEAAALLLARGADPRAESEGAQTPLHVTAFNLAAGAEMAGLLLDAGVEIDARNKHKATALVLSAQQGNLALIAVLLDHGANPALRSVGGRTALQAARAAGQDETAAFIEERLSP